MRRFGWAALLLLSNCTASQTADNCGNLQQTCLDQGKCLVSTNSGTSGGSVSGGYGATGASASGSLSESASCGFTCSECGDGGSSASPAGTVNYNCSTGAVCGNGNSVGGNTNGGGGGTTDHNTDAGPTSGPSNQDQYGPWQACFNPLVEYQTGTLVNPNCAAYCQSEGLTITTNCWGPNPNSMTVDSYADTLVWCQTDADTCGNLLEYPNLIVDCEGASTGTPCVFGVSSTVTGETSEWDQLLPCSGGLIQSIQCCCN